MAWLADAADARDAMAMALHAAAPYKRRELAAAFALDLALPTGAPNSEDLLAPAGTTSRSPAVYYEAAAHAGNPEAAYRLGRLKEAQGEYWDAARWFNLAAEAHHPEAIQRIEKMKP
ncbi:hypothetical protein GCM10009550_24470 [Actinocorallia libanotica]|uniref:Sel1 repeat family protein n=2 Tax=Actinocorallia libanotica TaxID=46162 RepID=A0ABN1QW61_9ACTN